MIDSEVYFSFDPVELNLPGFFNQWQKEGLHAQSDPNITTPEAQRNL